jgi:hypothetical protein
MGKKSRRRHAEKPFRVFVSHATVDKWLATTLCEKDIEGGDEIPDRIRRELIKSDELLILATPLSVQRPWVLLEAGAFWGRRKNNRIVVVLEHVTIDLVPEHIRSKKAIPLNDFDGYLRELSRRSLRRTQ